MTRLASRGMVVSVCIVATTAAGVAGQAADPPVAAQGGRGAEEFTERLHDVGTGRVRLSITELRGLIQEGLASASPPTRAATLSTAAALAMARRQAEIVGSGQVVVDDGTLLEVRSTAFGELRNPATVVRHAAILAIGNIDSVWRPRQMSPDFAEMLLEVYRIETSRQIRREIVKGFALVNARSTEGVSVLRDALTDSDPEILQFAALGVAEGGHADLLPMVAPLLQHAYHGARITAAQAMTALAAYGRPYLAALQAAAASEVDAATLATLEAAIAAVRAVGRE